MIPYDFYFYLYGFGFSLFVSVTPLLCVKTVPSVPSVASQVTRGAGCCCVTQ